MVNNKKIKKAISLAPTSKAVGFELYEDYITEILEENVENYNYYYDEKPKKKNHNIAVTGGYGAGKSSIIRTYFNKHLNYNVLYVTLGSYLENNEGNDFNEKEIELSILQQIIYTIKPSDMPFSRINRIDKNKENCISYSVLIALLMTSFLGLMIYIFNLDTFNKLASYSYCGLVVTSFVLCIFIIIWVITYYIITHFSISSISIGLKNTKLEVDNSNISILNGYVDELIVFFENSNYDIVIFEDIDRLTNSKKIFSKLKEINEIINNSIKNKTIRFIYSVKDNEFKNAEHRIKFFDAIIPIIPYAHYNTSHELLAREFKKCLGIEFEKSDLRRIGSYISNSRFALDIVNEYTIFKNNAKENANIFKKELVYLVSYKVIYPDRFDLLYTNKGPISYYLSPEFKMDVTKHFKEKEVEEKRKIKNNINENKKNYMREMLKKIKKHISETLDFDLEYAAFYNLNNDKIVSIEDLEKDIEKIYQIRDDKVVLKEDDNIEGDYYDEKEIFNYEENMNKEKFFEEIDNSKFSKEIEKITNEIADIENDENFYTKIKTNDKNNYFLKFEFSNMNEKYSIDILNNSDTKKSYINNEPNDFEKMLISNEIINENTKNLISTKYNKELSYNDNIILEQIIGGREVPFDIILESPSKVLDELSVKDFSQDSLCIVQLYNELLKSKNKNDYIKAIFYNLTPNKINFFKTLEILGNPFLDEKYIMSNYFNSIWKVLANEQFSNEVLFYYSVRTLELIEKSEIDKYSFFYNVLQEYKDILGYLEKNYDKIKNKIVNFDIKFKSSVDFDSNYHNMMKTIYENNMFILDLTQINAICKCLKLKFEETSILESSSKFNQNENNPIFNLLLDIDESLPWLNKLGIKQNDSEDFLKTFIKANISTNEEMEYLLKIENLVFKDIEGIEKKFYDLLKKYNKIEMSWHNVFLLYKNYGLDDDLVQLIVNNKDFLIKTKYDNVSYSSLTYEIFKNTIFDEETLGLLCDNILNNRSYTTVKNFPIRNLKLLIRKNKIRLDNIEEYLNVLNNDELNIGEKSKVLINSFDNFKNDKIEGISSDILIEVLKSTLVDSQSKINFVFNNETLLENTEIKHLIFQIILKDKIEIDKDRLIEILKYSESPFEKVKIYNNYYNILKDVSKKDILNMIGGDYVKMIDREKNIKFPKTDYNRLFLDSINENKDFFDHYNEKGSNIYIAYNPSRKK